MKFFLLTLFGSIVLVNGWPHWPELIPEQCHNSVSYCNQTANIYGSNVTFACSVASGAFPMQVPPTLPLYYEGNYDLCATFKDAHYCTIRTGVLGVPLLKGGVLPIGQFRINQCVSKSCKAEMLQDALRGNLKAIASAISKIVPKKDRGDIAKLEEFIAKDVVVDCMENRGEMDGSGYFVVYFGAVVLGLTILSTLIHSYVPRRILTEKLWSYVRVFSAKHNSERLLSKVEGDFNIFNGMRFFSMIWVIVCHSLLAYSYPPPVNPNKFQSFMESFSFWWVGGGEYAVDTFFFMSGFLAAWIVLKEISKTKLSGKLFFTMVFLRYIRLTPAYLFMLVGWWKVQPHMTNGPNWFETNFELSIATTDTCKDYFWTNALYLQNLIPLGEDIICGSWTWYLADDFQFFLLVPFIVQLFLIGRKRGNWLYKYGPCLLLVVIQVVSTSALIIHYDHNGSFLPINSRGKGFFSHVYDKPWSRVTPYAIGVALALFHFERVESGVDWRSWGSSKVSMLASHLGLGAGVTVMVGWLMAHYPQWRCDDKAENCNAWFAQINFGYLVLPNWDATMVALYYAGGYVIWSLAIALVSYSLICNKDPIGVKWILEAPIFTPLARLTYVAYLFHLPIIMLVHFSAPVLPFFSWPNAIMEFIGNCVVAYGVAVIVYLTLEKPSMNLVALLFSRHNQRRKRCPSGQTEEYEEEETSDEGLVNPTTAELENNALEAQPLSTEPLLARAG